MGDISLNVSSKVDGFLGKMFGHESILSVECQQNGRCNVVDYRSTVDEFDGSTSEHVHALPEGVSNPRLGRIIDCLKAFKDRSFPWFTDRCGLSVAAIERLPFLYKQYRSNDYHRIRQSKRVGEVERAIRDPRKAERLVERFFRINDAPLSSYCVQIEVTAVADGETIRATTETPGAFNLPWQVQFGEQFERNKTVWDVSLSRRLAHFLPRQFENRDSLRGKWWYSEFFCSIERVTGEYDLG